MLDTKEKYLLDRSRSHHPKQAPTPLLHIRFSAETLAQVVQSGRVELSIANTDGEEPILFINSDQHVLHKSIEASPHHIYRLGSPSKHAVQPLECIGHVKSKLSVRSGGLASSASAALKLKERREEEVARKSEHRAVLLTSAPATSKAKSGSGSLKLRAKALAPSSPLMGSRAGTPLEGISRAAGTGASAHLTRQTSNTQNAADARVTPRSATASRFNHDEVSAGLRRALLQYLALGPRSGADIVRDIPFTESQIGTILPQIARTHEQLPSSSNRRTSGRQSAQVSVQSTAYELNDEAWKDVLIKDWTKYNEEEKARVSKAMQVVLDRLSYPSDAPARQQLVRNDVGSQSTRSRPDARAETASAKPKADHSEGVANTLAPPASSSKKPTTKERLAKAAKGKALTTQKAPIASASVADKSGSKEKKPVTRHAAAQAKISVDSEPTKAKKKKEVSLDYTDSEEEDGQSRRTSSVKAAKSTSSAAAVEAHRSQKAIERSEREPWLDVRSVEEWHELAKRFRQAYGQYQVGLTRVREEEVKVQRELDIVRAAGQDRSNQENGRRRNSIRTRSSSNGKFASAINDEEASEEREEGEADSAEPPSHGPFKWRDGGDAEEDNLGEPMPLEEMESLVISILEVEGQLRRMKTALQTSRDRLEKSEA